MTHLRSRKRNTSNSVQNAESLRTYGEAYNGSQILNMATALTSWKSIAKYMGTCVRTVQRWTVERGFPVRGAGGGHKGLVNALTEEIDDWVRSQSLHGSLKDSRSDVEFGKKIVALQSEIQSLRVQLSVSQTHNQIRTKRPVSEDLLIRSAELCKWSSLLKEEQRELIESCRTTCADVRRQLEHLHFV